MERSDALKHFARLVSDARRRQFGDAKKWITVHPNGKDSKGSPVKIDSGTGEVLAGMGGKFTGQHISAVPKKGTEEQAGAGLKIDRDHALKSGFKYPEPKAPELKPSAPKAPSVSAGDNKKLQNWLTGAIGMRSAGDRLFVPIQPDAKEADRVVKDLFGLEILRDKGKKISGGVINGEKLSNTAARRLYVAASNAYYDLNTERWVNGDPSFRRFPEKLAENVQFKRDDSPAEPAESPAPNEQAKEPEKAPEKKPEITPDYSSEESWLKSIGGDVWERGNHKRIYLSKLPEEAFGLKIDRDRRGVLQGATLNGQHISNSDARSYEFALDGAYYDCKAHEFRGVPEDLMNSLQYKGERTKATPEENPWKRATFGHSNIERETAKASLIAMPKKSDYGGYSFWVSNKLLRYGSAGDIDLSVKNGMEFKLTKKDSHYNVIDTKTISAEEMLEALKGHN